MKDNITVLAILSGLLYIVTSFIIDMFKFEETNEVVRSGVFAIIGLIGCLLCYLEIRFRDLKEKSNE